MGWKKSLNRAIEHGSVQWLVALALMVPLIATVGQFWNTGFFRQTARVAILFWPGVDWTWALPMNVTVIVAFFAVTYLAGIGLLVRRRALGKVALAGLGSIIVAQLIGAAVNHFTGWAELQQLGTMDLAGKANRAILALWHNPIWEEVVFRGVPLAGLALVVKKWPGAKRPATWCYLLVPSLVFAAYHVPGHGYSRITDTFILGVIFAWLALHYGFSSVVVLHYIFDAVAIMSLSTMKNIPTREVQWLADHFTILNSTWTLATGAALLLMPILFLRNAFLRQQHA